MSQRANQSSATALRTAGSIGKSPYVAYLVSHSRNPRALNAWIIAHGVVSEDTPQGYNTQRWLSDNARTYADAR